MPATAERYADILYEVKNAVARVTINQPDKLNAFTPYTVKELTQAVRRAGSDVSVGVIVLTGAGERAFSAGGDVSVENEETFRAGDDSFDTLVKGLYRAFRECLKPVIARVDGYAIGGGHHMAHVTDFTVASDRSIFGQNGSRVASPAEGWLVNHVWTVVGMKRAKEIWMLCRRYTAQQPLDRGLVNAVVPPEQLDSKVARWCEDLLALSPTMLKLIKKSFDDSTAHIREQQTEESRAFLEKRTPDFSPWR